MATYDEMVLAVEANQSAALRQRVRAAIPITCDKIRLAHLLQTPPPNDAFRMLFARAALMDPERFVTPMLRAAIAQTPGLTLAQIQGASDAAVQGAIDAVVDLFAVAVP